MNDLVLKIHSLGLTTVPSSDNPTMPEYKKYLGELLNLETGLTVAVRFEIGNTLLEVPLEHGDKFAFCEKHFGERAIFMMECMKIAREWVYDQSVGWSWSHYKLTYARPKEQKLELIKQYKQKKIRTVEHIKSILQRWDEDTQNAKISAKRSQIVHVDDLLQHDNNVIEAEYKPETPALPPAPNTVNPGPWCECGEPCGDDGTLCMSCIEKAKALAPPEESFFSAPVTSFKVEGDTVQQGTYQPPTRAVAPVMMDNGRPVILFNHAVRTIDPEIDHVRCIVPAGMCLKEGDLFTVAVIRCQMP
jgi:hypothetical protein